MATPTAHTKGKFVIPDGTFGFLSFLVPLLGCTLFASISLLVVNEISDGVLLFLAIYFYWGFTIVPNTEYLVVERFGEFNRIIHSGPRILNLPGLIDKIADRGTLRYRELPIFTEDEGKPYVVDFKDGASSPVVGKISYRIGPQDDSEKSLDDAIYLFTYTMRNPTEREERIKETIESEAIPRMQALELSEALLQKDSIANQVTMDEQVRGTLEAMGVELNIKKGFILSDISIPQEVIELRQKKLKGEMEAEEQSAQGLGYARSINAIQKSLEVSKEEARSIYETQRSLEVLGMLKSNVSFVASDIKSIQKTMGVGPYAGSHSPKPETDKETAS